MYPIDDVLIKPWNLVEGESGQTGRSPIAKQMDNTKTGITHNKQIRLPAGDVSRAPRNPQRVFVNPYSTPDQLIEAPTGIESAKQDGAGNMAGSSDENRSPAKYYNLKTLTQTQPNNKHSGFAQRQQKFRNSPFAQAFRKTLTGLNALTIEPTNNPSRKIFNRAYTPPLQVYRVMIRTFEQPSGLQTPVGRREMQPSIIMPGPQHPINTGMNWASGLSGRYPTG